MLETSVGFRAVWVASGKLVVKGAVIIFPYITLYQLGSWASQVVLLVKNPPANASDLRDVSLIPGWENPLEKGMATHSSILAWRIPWTKKPGGLPSIGSQRAGHD